MLQLFVALKARWDDDDLDDVFTGIYESPAPTTATRPYVVVMPTMETRLTRSNKGGYYGESFECHVIANSSSSVATLADILKNSLLRAPLTSSGPDRILQLEEGVTRYQEEDQYWRAIIELTGRTGKVSRLG